jgi:single-stranded-DNA-specific exonuclease
MAILATRTTFEYTTASANGSSMSRISVRRREQVQANALTGVHPLLQRVYAARGVNDAAQLQLTLDRMLPLRDLEGITDAVQLLLEHRQGRILIVGDFDADGATSTALVVRQLRRLGFASVNYLVPNRFKFGYGLTPEIVQLAAEQKPTLIVTVDNGVSSLAGVAAAQALGMHVLITDHHLAANELPQAVIVNPNLPGQKFASKALAGVGVAFYVMAALTRELKLRGEADQPIANLLDLVAVGTVADLVPLDYNNRILVEQGLRRIRAGQCVPGIRALLEIAGKKLDRVIASDLGFQLGPRLNAAGRLDDMSIGIECLLTDDEATAQRLAAQLTQLNLERREIEQRMQEDALAIVAEMHMDDEKLPLGVCLYDDHWHQGVVGLVASRVKDRVHRPVIAMARGDGDTLKGSARSVSGVHIRDVLDAIAAAHPGLIDKFGGHAMAAGLTLQSNRLDDFKTAFDAEVSRWMSIDDAHGVLHSDGELQIDEFNLDAARLLRHAGPWGQAFPEPMFDGAFKVIETRVLGERHLKLKVKPTADLSTQPIEAIAFRHFDHEDAANVSVGSTINMAFRMDVNEYGGTERLQLIVEHLHLA